jgi:uncharacterized protein (TIGR00369 family)
VIAFCLLAALVYRASVSLMPPGVAEDAFVSGVAAFLLVVALLMKRATAFSAYWEIPFAFFVFYVGGLLGDGNISPLQRWFVSDVLHESTSGGNPLASTVTGTVLAQLFGTVLIAIPIVGLTIASRRNLAEIFIAKPSNRWPIVVGVVCFVLIGFLALRGRTVAFFPIHGDFTTSRFVALAPALIVHGGAIATLADEALATVAFTLANEGEATATSSLHIDYYRPAALGKLVARATVRHRTKRLAYCHATVEQEDGQVVAEGRAVIAYVRG